MPCIEKNIYIKEKKGETGNWIKCCEDVDTEAVFTLQEVDRGQYVISVWTVLDQYQRFITWCSNRTYNIHYLFFMICCVFMVPFLSIVPDKLNGKTKIIVPATSLVQKLIIMMTIMLTVIKIRSDCSDWGHVAAAESVSKSELNVQKLRTTIFAVFFFFFF